MRKFSNFKGLLWLLAGIICLSISACSDVEEKDLNNNKPDNTTPAPPKKEEEKIPKVHKDDEYTETKVDLGFTKEDKDYLKLYETFPMGTTSKAIHDKLPAMKGVRPEGGSNELAAQGLTESKIKITFLGKPADLEFNFKNDSLYSFYITVTEHDFNKADNIYKGIKQHYNKEIGPGVEPTVEEETRDIKNCYWSEKAPYGVITYQINSGIISWGFQNEKPDQPSF